MNFHNHKEFITWTDQELHKAYLPSRNTKILETLIARHIETIMSVARGFAKKLQDQEDIAMSAIERIYKYVNSFNSTKDGNFAAWVARITRNHAINEYRKDKVLKDYKQGYLLQQQFLNFRNPETLLISQEFFDKVDEVLNNEMPPELARAFIACKIKGMKYEEFAEQEGIPLGTCKSRVFHANKKFQKVFANLGKPKPPQVFLKATKTDPMELEAMRVARFEIVAA